jgi:hypothetical protein
MTCGRERDGERVCLLPLHPPPSGWRVATARGDHRPRRRRRRRSRCEGASSGVSSSGRDGCCARRTEVGSSCTDSGQHHVRELCGVAGWGRLSGALSKVGASGAAVASALLLPQLLRVRNTRPHARARSSSTAKDPPGKRQAGSCTAVREWGRVQGCRLRRSQRQKKHFKSLPWRAHSSDTQLL